jgi:hypothetical protein
MKYPREIPPFFNGWIPTFFFLVVNNIISNYIPSNHDTTPICSWWGVLSIPNVSPDFQKNWAEPADPIKDPHDIPVNSIKLSYLLDNISFYPHIYIIIYIYHLFAINLHINHQFSLNKNHLNPTPIYDITGQFPIQTSFHRWCFPCFPLFSQEKPYISLAVAS